MSQPGSLSPFILITGTGKSGTTVVAKSFYDAGIPMGKESELLTFPGGGGNRKGVWEHAAAVALNESYLERHGGSWSVGPKDSIVADESTLYPLKNFRDQHPDLKCIKDPRLTWTKELWQQVYSDVVVVVCFRSPMGFYESLKRAQPDSYSETSGSKDAALKSWFVMNQELLKYAEKYPVMFFNFDDSPARMEQGLSEILRRLGYRFQREAFRHFFASDERHFQVNVLEQNSDLPEYIQQTWDALRIQSFFQGMVGAEVTASPEKLGIEILTREYRLEAAYLEAASSSTGGGYEYRQRLEREEHYQLLINRLSAKLGELQDYDRKWIRWQVKAIQSVRPGGFVYRYLKKVYFQLRRRLPGGGKQVF